MKKEHPERIAAQKGDIDGLRNYIASLTEQSNEITKEIRFLKELEISLPNLELILPQYTFSHTFTIYGTKRKAIIQTLGGGHSPCDSFLYIPEDEILFMADLLFVGMHPSFFPYSNPTQWKHILGEVQSYSIQKAIPGHGTIGTKEDIVKLRNYIDVLEDLAKKNLNTEDIVIPEEFKDWTTVNIDTRELFIQNVELFKELASK